MITAAVIIGLILLGLIIFLNLPNIKEKFGFDDGIFAGICVSMLFVIEVVIVVDIESKPTPTAMDVYQGKTTLEITYRDSIPVDSVVVWKGDMAKKIKKNR